MDLLIFILLICIFCYILYLIINKHSESYMNLNSLEHFETTLPNSTSLMVTNGATFWILKTDASQMVTPNSFRVKPTTPICIWDLGILFHGKMPSLWGSTLLMTCNNYLWTSLSSQVAMTTIIATLQETTWTTMALSWTLMVTWTTTLSISSIQPEGTILWASLL